MKDMLNKAKAKAGQLSRDLRPEAADIKRSADLAIDTAGKVAGEVGRLGKDVLKSDMAKDAAAGAAIGAVIAVPVPLIGPMAGAVIGAGLGVYKNIMRPNERRAERPVHEPILQPPPVIDVIATDKAGLDKFEELNKLHELKVNGVLTDEEFASEKKKILDR